MALPARIQVVLRTADNVPANFITNSLCLWTDTGADTAATETAIIKFYDAIKPHLSNHLAQNGHELIWSALPGTPPNYPFRTRVWNLASNPSATGLPTEVAMVLSFQGVKAAGFPQGRRRGRIFIGPLGSGVNGTDGRPTPTARTAIANAAATLKTDLAAPGGQHWAVWSSVDGQSVEIDNGWVDNAFDTQRRRGVQVTARTTWS